jgi:hypothetical protein
MQCKTLSKGSSIMAFSSLPELSFLNRKQFLSRESALLKFIRFLFSALFDISEYPVMHDNSGTYLQLFLMLTRYIKDISNVSSEAQLFQCLGDMFTRNGLLSVFL